jgi:hypothetical protein
MILYSVQNRHRTHFVLVNSNYKSKANSYKIMIFRNPTLGLVSVLVLVIISPSLFMLIIYNDNAFAQTKVETAPLADAGPNQRVVSGTIVTLDGRGSHDLDGDKIVKYSWQQYLITTAPQIVLSNSSSSTPSFGVPDVKAPLNITFQLIVNDGKHDSAPVYTIVHVFPKPNNIPAIPTTTTNQPIFRPTQLSPLVPSKPTLPASPLPTPALQPQKPTSQPQPLVLPRGSTNVSQMTTSLSTQKPALPQQQQRQQPQSLNPILPYFMFPQQLLLQQPNIAQLGSIATTEGFNTRGSINSLIYTIHTIWIATGNWSMGVNNGSPTSFKTNMSWFNNNGTSDHTHEFLNFKPTGGGKVIKVQQPVNSVFVKGVMDVGTNHKISWKNVPTTISINGGKTITILLDDKATNHHFAGQPIFGVVTSFVRCSDTPGPNMEVLPPCS